jgi:hypothetical protein
VSDTFRFHKYKMMRANVWQIPVQEQISSEEVEDEMKVTEARHFLWRRCGGLVDSMRLSRRSRLSALDSCHFVYL